MSQSVEDLTAAPAEAPPAPQAPAIESPPPAPQPPRESAPDPRARLHQLADELIRTRNRRALIEFLQLRRALR
jgi:hypothetical protein